MKKTDFVVNFKGVTGGGRVENTVTLPIWLAYRFSYDLGAHITKEELKPLEEFHRE